MNLLSKIKEIYVVARVVDLEALRPFPSEWTPETQSGRHRTYQVTELELTFDNPSVESLLRNLQKGDKIKVKKWSFTDQDDHDIQVDAGEIEILDDVRITKDAAYVTVDLEVEAEVFTPREP